MSLSILLIFNLEVESSKHFIRDIFYSEFRKQLKRKSDSLVSLSFNSMSKFILKCDFKLHYEINLLYHKKFANRLINQLKVLIIYHEKGSVEKLEEPLQTQKQPPEVFYEKRCSYKFHKIRRKTHVPESLF